MSRYRLLSSGLLRCVFLSALVGLSIASCGSSSPTAVTSDAPPVATGPFADILARSDLPLTQATPLPGDPMEVTVHRLDNGLTVYISPMPDQPVLAAIAAVRAGSRHDPADATGLAHYLEHMILFKGSDELGVIDGAAEKPHLDRIAALYRQLRDSGDGSKRKTILAAIDRETQSSARYAVANEIQDLFPRIGINRFDANTNRDVTRYWARVPSNRLAPWARVQAEQLRDTVFRQFYPELESVYEEKNIQLDDPEIVVFNAMVRALFPDHSYGQPVLGTVEHLKSPAFDEMVAFYRRWYAPNNIAVILSGDIDAKTALPIVQREFGDWKPRILPQPEAGSLKPNRERRTIDITAPGPARVYITWQTAPTAHPDHLAIELIHQLVDNTTTGLARVDLVITNQVAEAYSDYYHLREAGMWTLVGTARTGQSLAEVEVALLDVLTRIKQGEISQDAVAAARLDLEMAEQRRLDSPWSRAEFIESTFIQGVPWSQVVGAAARRRQLGPSDLAAVARRYFGDAPVVVYRRTGENRPPKLPRPNITPLPENEGKRSTFARAIEAMDSAPLVPEVLREGEHYSRATLPSGPLIAA
ncbi:MAG: pitrilysin family protein, partial [Myxococcota bacterium]